MSKQIDHEKTGLQCTQCKAHHKRTGKRLPRGWKHAGEDFYCPDCWTSHYILRAVTMQVIEPLDGTWDELRSALHSMWGLTTQMSNWMMTELYARDVRRNGQPKMPPMPRAYLYPDARLRFPDFPPQSVASLEQMCQRKYRAKRHELIWTCATSLPSFRYPAPFPVHNQSWDVGYRNKQPIITARIAERKWSLRLKGSARYHRQLAAFTWMAKGKAQRGQLDFMHRSDGSIMAKLVAWLPRPQTMRDFAGILRVRSTPESLLVAMNVKDKRLWVYNADHLRRWQAEHRQLVQRLAEDQKAEQRPIPTFAQRRTAAREKYAHRMRSAVQQIAASLVNYAVARRFAEIQYDDLDKSFCPEFTWFALADQIKIKADEYGIRFVASASVENEIKESLAEEEVSGKSDH